MPDDHLQALLHGGWRVAMWRGRFSYYAEGRHNNQTGPSIGNGRTIEQALSDLREKVTPNYKGAQGYDT